MRASTHPAMLPGILLGTLFGSLAGLSSCTLVDLAKDPPAKRRFLFSVPSVPIAATPTPTPTPKKTFDRSAGVRAPTRAKGPIVAVEPAHALSPFNGRPLIFRTGTSEHEADFYNEYLVPPAEQITQIVRRWLRDRGTFPHVISSGSPLAADHLLTIDVLDLRGDLRDPAKPRAVVELRLALFRIGPEREMLFAKRYRAEVAIAADRADALVGGFDRGLAQILTEATTALAPFGKSPAVKSPAVKAPAVKSPAVKAPAGK